jgi:16S rRNA (guanine966-N2)-methyltransferase
LPLPEGVPGLRPTASRVREAIFDRLGPAARGARVLDLFAGSGALSIEALSRGAQHAVLLDVDARVVRHLERQLAALKIERACTVRRSDAQAFVDAAPPGAPFDLVFVDPPFATPHVMTPLLAALAKPGWLADAAIVVCEHERVRGTATVIECPAGLVREATRIYGQAQVEFFARD